MLDTLHLDLIQLIFFEIIWSLWQSRAEDSWNANKILRTGSDHQTHSVAQQRRQPARWSLFFANIWIKHYGHCLMLQSEAWIQISWSESCFRPRYLFEKYSLVGSEMDDRTCSYEPLQHSEVFSRRHWKWNLLSVMTARYKSTSSNSLFSKQTADWWWAEENRYLPFDRRLLLHEHRFFYLNQVDEVT